MSRHVVDVHLKDGPQGPYFIGNLEFPGSHTFENPDFVVKIYPKDEGEEDSELMALLRQLLADYNGKFEWSLEIEPRRKPKEQRETT